MKKLLFISSILIVLATVFGCNHLFKRENTLASKNPRPAVVKDKTAVAGVEASWGSLTGKQVTILYTNTTNGILKSCGCPGNPYGGLPQRAQMIKMLRQQDPGLLLLDSGDTLSAIFQPGNERDIAHARYVFEAYQAMKYDAIGIGDQDLVLGVDFFEEALKKYELPWLSATLLKLPRREPLVEGTRYIKRKKFVVALTSVISPKTFFFFPQKNLLLGKLLIQEPDKVLANQLPTYEKAADLTVVISHLGIDRDKQLAASFPGIDVIIGGHTQTLLEQPVKIGHTIIVQAGSSGEHLGKLTLYLDRKNNINGYSNLLIPLNEQVPADPLVNAIIEQYYHKSRQGATPEAVREMAAQKKLVYPESNCGLCHYDEHQTWYESKHRTAFLALERSGRTDEVECLFCHTTGFGYRGGFISREKTPALAAVGCLNCHYTSIRDGVKIRSLASTGKKKICIGCHTKQKSPDFDYDRYWKRISH